MRPCHDVAMTSSWSFKLANAIAVNLKELWCCYFLHERWLLFNSFQVWKPRNCVSEFLHCLIIGRQAGLKQSCEVICCLNVYGYGDYSSQRLLQSDRREGSTQLCCSMSPVNMIQIQITLVSKALPCTTKNISWWILLSRAHRIFVICLFVYDQIQFMGSCIRDVWYDVSVWHEGLISTNFVLHCQY